MAATLRRNEKKSLLNIPQTWYNLEPSLEPAIHQGVDSQSSSPNACAREYHECTSPGCTEFVSKVDCATSYFALKERSF